MKATDLKVLDGAAKQSEHTPEDIMYEMEELSNMMTRISLMKRTKAVDKEATIALVKAAQGDRSMRQFADDMGVNVSSVSRILNGTVTEIRPHILSSIAYNAAPGSGVTLDKLMEAQGLTVTEERRPVGKRERWESQQVITNELLIRGYSVRYSLERRISNMRFYPDYEVMTDAFHGNGEKWYFIDKLCRKVKKVSIAMIDSWIDSIMAAYYQGLEAKRVSVVVDSDDLYRTMKIILGRCEIKNELSVILISMETGKVLEEFVAPLTDGRTAELVLTGEIKEEQND